MSTLGTKVLIEKIPRLEKELKLLNDKIKSVTNDEVMDEMEKAIGNLSDRLRNENDTMKTDMKSLREQISKVISTNVSLSKKVDEYKSTISTMEDKLLDLTNEVNLLKTDSD